MAGCQMPTKPLYHSPPQQDKDAERKMKKILWVKIKAIRKSKGRAEAKETKNNYSPATAWEAGPHYV